MSQSSLQLSPADNVLVLTRTLNSGEFLEVGGVRRQLQGPLGLGHKIAACDIAPGEKIIKYGASIGSATVDIRAGEHVHLHNMKSDYLPTFTLEEGRQFASH